MVFGIRSLILFDITCPGFHVSDTSMGPPHLQVFFADLQLDGWESLFFSSSQHLSSALARCFFPQCLQMGALLYHLHLSSRFIFFSSFNWLLGAFCSFLMRDIISFMASVVLLMNVSIWHVWFSVRVAISSSVALACSLIMFALKFFVVSLFCLFSFACSVKMKVLIFCHVF
jgi:hypothetical protein